MYSHPDVLCVCANRPCKEVHDSVLVLIGLCYEFQASLLAWVWRVRGKVDIGKGSPKQGKQVLTHLHILVFVRGDRIARQVSLPTTYKRQCLRACTASPVNSQKQHLEYQDTYKHAARVGPPSFLTSPRSSWPSPLALPWAPCHSQISVILHD